MSLPRFHLFELTDEPWCPRVIRRLMTDYLSEVTKLTRIHEPAVAPIVSALRRCGEHRIVDLCSGAGGPLLHVRSAIEHALAAPLDVVLTDKFPNDAAIARFEREAAPGVRYLADSIDARSVPRDLRGIRTIFDAFHHFRPEEAQQILQDAVFAGAGIAVVESTERRPLTMATFLFVPLIVLFVTPRVRPRAWWRWLFTYVLPIAPFSVFWDAMISCLRSYSEEELRAMIDRLEGPVYTWEIGHARRRGTVVTWLVGYPA